MTAQQALQQLQAKLAQSLYDEREASNIVRIISEDVLRIFNTNSLKILTTAQLEQLDIIAQELLAGKPLQYVLGMADFYGYKFHVDANVLIPRPETEELVYNILSDYNDSPKTVLDIGTGSGCIPISLKKNRPNWQVSAIDVSEGALLIAQKNALFNDVEVAFSQQDILDETLWQELPQLDIIISNPPYIPTKEISLMPKHVTDHEPHLALFVDNDDPLIFYRKITKLASSKLSPNGRIYFETNEFNVKIALDTLTKDFDFQGKILQDLSGKDRMLVLWR